MSDEPQRQRRYLPLIYRVAGLNALLLAVAVVLTLVVLAPQKFSSVAAEEAIVLIAALMLVTVGQPVAVAAAGRAGADVDGTGATGGSDATGRPDACGGIEI